MLRKAVWWLAITVAAAVIGTRATIKAGQRRRQPPHPSRGPAPADAGAPAGAPQPH